MRKILLSLVVAFTGCATPLDDTTIVSLINNRLTNLEQKSQVNPIEVKNIVIRDSNGGLTDAQKDFIRVMMDYLGEKK